MQHSPGLLGRAGGVDSFAKRLINRHGPHMKAISTTWWRVGNGRIGVSSLDRTHLILENSDVG
jgi:hypothetical protein